jgi:hypothetical protein
MTAEYGSYHRLRFWAGFWVGILIGGLLGVLLMAALVFIARA